MSDKIREQMRAAVLIKDEAAQIEALGAAVALESGARARIVDAGAALVRQVRGAADPGLMEAFLAEYGLSTDEGVALMCLAEALLRVPDAETIDDLIADKIVPHDWRQHAGDSGSLMVNASTWALMLTGRVLGKDQEGVVGTLRGLARRMGEPVIRLAVARAMREMGAQFVLGEDMDEATRRGKSWRDKGYGYSFDMLGEAARTEADALRYLAAYKDAIASCARAATGGAVADNPGISVKLSALHPRYEVSQAAHMLPVLRARLLELARDAAQAGIGLNVDAEEQDRLDLSLDVIGPVFEDPALEGWDGFGVVVQAYGPRAPHVIDWLDALAARTGRRIMIRLVKGAYWDTEIKRAQVLGLDGFPVWTRKTHTDVSYMACARKLLGLRARIYPQFATHNAHTVAAVLEMAGDREGYEFQRLHGMGEALHEAVRMGHGTRCRIYAPVGAHEDLLAYLVRRLLENGANSSFVNQIVDEDVPAEEIASDPLAALAGHNPAIEQPGALYVPERRNSRGWDLTDPVELAQLDAARAPFAAPCRWEMGTGVTVTNPAHPQQVVGTRDETPAEAAGPAIRAARAAQTDWAAEPVAARAEALRRAADLYEDHAGELFALLTREAGKSLADGVAELREAVDFLRYYAAQAEQNEALGAPRGVIVCISPWNFPLAIFTGQIAAALVTGNAVIAKPAEQTGLVAMRATALLHEAGIPAEVLRLLPGDGAQIGAALTADPGIDGVCFTGSTEVAQIIDRQLAHTAPHAMLIAETGGLNAMIVDSTALPEQAVRDIIAGAYQSAGQRCSALRVLYVQEDVADRLITMLKGAMDALSLGDPWDLATDVGPVIDAEAHGPIAAYVAARRGALLHEVPAPDLGHFIAPALLEVGGIEELSREIFGPVLHVARFAADQLGEVIAQINGRGYGLTFGLHSRIDSRVHDVVARAEVGNIYVNRNQIGAIVGSQPFGGQGLSGTGPKAGGPFYLPRFCAPRALETAPLEFGQASLPPAPKDAGWAARTDRVPMMRQALRGQAAAAMGEGAALDMGPMDLPGPTGELNRLMLTPRGLVLCLGPGAELARDQAVQALATGNRVIVAAKGAKAAMARLVAAGAPVAVLDETPSCDAILACAADAVACAGVNPELRRALAAQGGTDGEIRPILRARLAAHDYCHERALCIDTTAAGGNAALLAKAG